MAREYGMRPTEILGETGLPGGRQFHLDYDVYAATAQHIEEQREQAREQADPRSSRVASPEERTDMATGKESRAKQREQMQQAGMKAPTPDGQMSTLDKIRQEREEARQAADPLPGGETDG